MELEESETLHFYVGLGQGFSKVLRLHYKRIESCWLKRQGEAIGGHEKTLELSILTRNQVRGVVHFIFEFKYLIMKCMKGLYKIESCQFSQFMYINHEPPSGNELPPDDASKLARFLCWRLNQICAMWEI